MNHSKIAIIITVLFILLSPALAQTDPPVMTMGDCQALNTALKALDGHVATDDAGRPIMKLGERGGETPLIVPYTFAHGVIEKLADDETMLDKIVETIAAGSRARMAKEAPGETKVKPDSPVGIRLQVMYQEALAKPCPVTLVKIKTADLKIDDNRLPLSVVSALRFIMEPSASSR